MDPQPPAHGPDPDVVAAVCANSRELTHVAMAVVARSRQLCARSAALRRASARAREIRCGGHPVEVAVPAARGTDVIRDEPSWRYVGLDLRPVARRLRVWQVGSHQLVAVVTQRVGDTGTSVTCAVDMIWAQLAVEHPGHQIEVYQHYPADAFAGDQFDKMIVDETARRRWWRTDTDDLVNRLGQGLLTGPHPRSAAH